MESAFSFRLWQSLILVKLQAFIINGSKRFRDRAPERVYLIK